MVKQPAVLSGWILVVNLKEKTMKKVLLFQKLIMCHFNSEVLLFAGAIVSAVK